MSASDFWLASSQKSVPSLGSTVTRTLAPSGRVAGSASSTFPSWIIALSVTILRGGLRGGVEGYASVRFSRHSCRPTDSNPDCRSTLHSGEGLDLEIAPGPHGIRIRNAVSERDKRNEYTVLGGPRFGRATAEESGANRITPQS